MRLQLAGILAALTLACGGGDGGNGPSNVDPTGTWLVTFTSSPTSSCSLSQIAFDITKSQTGAQAGTHGSYAITCPGKQPNFQPHAGISNWTVSGQNFSIAVAALETLSGSINGGTYSGTFSWGVSLNGTFTAVKQ